jgi:hypothetical protein
VDFLISLIGCINLLELLNSPLLRRTRMVWHVYADHNLPNLLHHDVILLPAEWICPLANIDFFPPSPKYTYGYVYADHNLTNPLHDVILPTSRMDLSTGEPPGMCFTYRVEEDTYHDTSCKMFARAYFTVSQVCKR